MYFRLYFFDDSGRIEGVYPFDRATEGQALTLAREEAAGRSYELWCGKKLIVQSRVQQGDVAPPPSVEIILK
jgi:hypothetical protein